MYEKKHDIGILDDKIDLYNNILESYMVFQDNFLKRMLLKIKLLYSQINADITLETIECDKVSIITKINQYFRCRHVSKEFEQLIERDFGNVLEKQTVECYMVYISHTFKKWKNFILDNQNKKYEENMCILMKSFDCWKEFTITSVSTNKNMFQLIFEIFSKTILCIK